MKLLVFSDLHVDYNSETLGRNIAPDIAAYIREVAPDRVLVAGDMAGGAERCIRYIEEIQEGSGVPLSYVPGNHSVWTLDKTADSWQEYERLAAHPSSLIDRPVTLTDDWVLIGDMGWYDYSFEADTAREEVVKRKNSVWKDSVLARFGLEDEALTTHMLERVSKQFAAHADKQIVFANHFIPWIEYAPVSPHSEIWNMIRPFMGSTRLGALIDAHPNVQVTVFGHKHWRHGLVQRGDRQLICAPLGYVKEWRTGKLGEELRACGVVIEL